MTAAPTPRRLQRKTEMAKQRKAAARGHRIPEKVDVALKARAGWRCEVCGDPMLPLRCHRHHRKLRSQGGLDELPNLVLIHPACHNTVHNNPEWARQNGFIVDAGKTPSTVPILLHGTGRVRLGRDGSYREVA